MPCPNCGVGLTMADRLGVAIDRCASCGGVWLTRDKLDLLVERAVALGHSPASLHAARRNRPGGGYWFGKYPRDFIPA